MGGGWDPHMCMWGASVGARVWCSGHGRYTVDGVAGVPYAACHYARLTTDVRSGGVYENRNGFTDFDVFE